MRNVFKVIVVLSIILILFGGAFLCYDKFIKKDNEVETYDKNDEFYDDDGNRYAMDSRDLTNDEIGLLLEKVDKYNHHIGKYYPISDFSKIDNVDLFFFALGGMENKYGEINVEDMDNYIRFYFGDSVKLKHEDYICELDKRVMYKFSDNKYTFEKGIDGHGHGSTRRTITNIDVQYVDGQFIDGLYTISTKILYGGSCADVCGPNITYYKSYQDSLNGVNEIVKLQSDSITEAEKEVYRETLPITIFKFKEAGSGQLVLSSVEIK